MKSLGYCGKSNQLLQNKKDGRRWSERSFEFDFRGSTFAAGTTIRLNDLAVQTLQSSLPVRALRLCEPQQRPQFHTLEFLPTRPGWRTAANRCASRTPTE